MDVPGDPQLSEDDRRLYERGLSELEDRRFFECHDTLEEVWRGSRGEERAFLQGLIQLSVGCYHLQDGNLRGAASQLSKALDNLEDYPPRYLGVEVGALRGELRRLSALLEGGAPREALLDALPSLRRA